MNKIFLALGSNIGDKETYINRAIELLAEKITDIKIASLYTTAPKYYLNQENFLNTALSGQTSLSPEELHQFTKKIEKKVGRIHRFHYGPREIDIDILFYNDLIYKSEDLIIPHPLLHERDFTLLPLMDLDPDFIHPVFNKTIRSLKKSLQK